MKPVPVMVTVAPPAKGPEAAVTPVTVGAAIYVNWSAEEVAEVLPEPVTVTSTVAAVSAGLVAVISIGETTTTLVAAVVPNFTAVAP